jgi:ribosomal protein S18 acetylase RimI-like enzyme
LTAMFVRSAGERDLAAVRDLLVETWHATYDSIYGAGRVTAITDSWHSMRSLQARLARPRSEFLVADSGKGLGGMAFAVAGEDGKTLMLHQLYVRPNQQGHGIGGMLLDEILNCFPEAKSCRLEVEEGNARAVAFYEAYGFKHTGRTENVGGGKSGIPALVMERPLGEPPLT